MSGLLIATFFGTRGLATEWSLEQNGDHVRVNIDGKLFTEYIALSARKPILWPIIGPTGKPMTRAYPMRPAGEHEASDHLHHRSLWFTHGIINGIDFWSEREAKATDRVPMVQHRDFRTIQTKKDCAIITTRNDWLAPTGQRVLEDERTMTFRADDLARWIDFAITLKATDGNVTFGDTKEGTFGVRVAGTMKVDAKMGGKIVNSCGQTDEDAWGQPAEWVDYSGPVDGERVGIAIMSHPSNFRHPCRWHVRTYGLFTANPFGEADFPKSPNIQQGKVTIDQGKTLPLKYRVLFHRGDATEGHVADYYNDFLK